jgi:hypothetical protein
MHGREVYRILVGKPIGKRPLERWRHRGEDGIRMHLKKIGWGGGVAGSGECCDEPSGSSAMELVSTLEYSLNVNQGKLP